MNLDFGDYCLIEQKRYRGDNEMFLYKVVSGGMKSNVYRSVPVDGRDTLNGTEESRGEICDVILAIRCGVDETKVEKFRLQDVKPNTKFRTNSAMNFNEDRIGA